MKAPIVIKRGQEFYVEPRDKLPDMALANARLTEVLHEQLKMPNETSEPVPIKGEEHNFYCVTALGGSILRTIYDRQQMGDVPVVLWHRIGRGVYKRYQPHKANGPVGKMKRATAAVAAKKIKSLIDKGVVRRAD